MCHDGIFKEGPKQNSFMEEQNSIVRNGQGSCASTSFHICALNWFMFWGCCIHKCVLASALKVQKRVPGPCFHLAMFSKSYCLFLFCFQTRITCPKGTVYVIVRFFFFFCTAVFVSISLLWAWEAALEPSAVIMCLIQAQPPEPAKSLSVLGCLRSVMKTWGGLILLDEHAQSLSVLIMVPEESGLGYVVQHLIFATVNLWDSWLDPSALQYKGNGYGFLRPLVFQPQ